MFYVFLFGLVSPPILPTTLRVSTTAISLMKQPNFVLENKTKCLEKDSDDECYQFSGEESGDLEYEDDEEEEELEEAVEQDMEEAVEQDVAEDTR